MVAIATRLFLVAVMVIVSVSAKAVQVDECTCFELGNYYTTISRDHCKSFTQRTALLPAETQPCPAGTQFDPRVCVCNHEANFKCPANCPRAYTAPATVDSPTCTDSGNFYAQVPNTNCARFAQWTAHLRPLEHQCPAGLQFDIATCVCNHPKDTQCFV